MFGSDLSLSADGNTLAVGAQYEGSGATGIGGNQHNNDAPSSGAVYVFVRDDRMNSWSQQSYIKASNTDTGDRFGVGVALSADGQTLAVGARGEDSDATGIGGNQASLSAKNSGAVYVFVRSGMSWSQQAYVKASNTEQEDAFGSHLALSANGDTLAVGTIWEDSAATGIDGDQFDNSASEAGAAYVFVRNDMNSWSQQAYLKASNTHAGDSFGKDVALSDDGNVLAVAAELEGSGATEINGNPDNDIEPGSGAAYVFVRDEMHVWSQRSYVKAPNAGASDDFGYSLTLSADGQTLAVGAVGERSGATGIGGAQGDDNVGAGAVYVY